MLGKTRRLLRVVTPLAALMVAALMVMGPQAFAGEGKSMGAAAGAALVDKDGEKLAQPGQYSGHAGGLNVTITGVKIPKDRRPVVSFTATDDRGEPLGKNELTEVRPILSYLNEPGGGSTSWYVSYTTRLDDPTPGNPGDEEVQATTDAGGLAALKQLNNGSFKYKFATALPVGYSKTASHQIAIQMRRTFGATGESFPANPVLAFRPDGSSNVTTREIVTTETCNTCHSRMEFHGGARREVQYCIMCHTPQSTDAGSGNTVDMPDMIHKIHMGEQLPSVEGGDDYFIVGFGNTVHNYSDVAFPQDIRNCEVCHTGTEDQANFHLENPTMRGCASCHDRTWFNLDEETPEGYTDHPIGIALTDDTLCTACHLPTMPTVSPIFDRHLRPQEREEAPGVVLEITGHQILTPGTTPQLQITFTAEKSDGTPITDINTNALYSLGGTIAYPAEEISTYNRNVFKGTGASGTLVNNGGGSYTYTFNDANDTLPVGDTTFAMALESRVTFSYLNTQDVSVNATQGIADNQYFTFRVDGGEPSERRVSVLEESCNVCHGEIRAHGEQRKGVDYCLMCHNVNTTDEVRRDPVAPDTDPVTVNLKDMLHRIHRGEELASGYTVYGFGGTAHDFTHIRYPGDLRDCAQCHDDGAMNLPVAEGALATNVTENVGQPVSVILPERAACMSCHDSFVANLHAVLNSDIEGGAESCAVCHGEGKEFSVEAVHEVAP